MINVSISLVFSFISSDHVFNMWTQHIVNESFFSGSCEIESPPGDAGCDGQEITEKDSSSLFSLSSSGIPSTYLSHIHNLSQSFI